MAEPLADPDDLASFWRPLTAAETIVAESLLSVASAIVRRRFSDIDNRLASGALDPALVEYVVCEMVKAAVEATSRPAGAKSVSDSAGPYSRSVTFDAAAHMVLTDDLVDMILPPQSAPTMLGSLRLGLPDRCAPPNWPW